MSARKCCLYGLLMNSCKHLDSKDITRLKNDPRDGLFV